MRNIEELSLMNAKEAENVSLNALKLYDDCRLYKNTTITLFQEQDHAGLKVRSRRCCRTKSTRLLNW